METIRSTDVLIIGGGPAGVSTALSLLNYSDLSVTLIEQGDFSQPKVGEQVTSAMFEVLDYLQVDRDIIKGNHSVQGFTHLAAWGNDQLVARHSIYNVAGESYQIDREHFDLSLVEVAVESGAGVFPNTKCVEFKQQDDLNWRVTCRHQEQGEFQIEAQYLVDATGRNVFVARHLGVPAVRTDQLVGVGAFLESGAYENCIPEVILETVPEGWWYSAPLPGGRLNITLFTDASLVSKLRLGDPENWRACLGRTEHIIKKADGGSMDSSLWVRNAHSQMTDTAGRERFLAVGDAAASFDPLSSMGIGFAMTSAIHAAGAIKADLEGNGAVIQEYQTSVRANFHNYMNIKQQYYTSEKRWLDAPFWADRVGNPMEQAIAHSLV